MPPAMKLVDASIRKYAVKGRSSWLRTEFGLEMGASEEASGWEEVTCLILVHDHRHVWVYNL